MQVDVTLARSAVPTHSRPPGRWGRARSARFRRDRCAIGRPPGPADDQGRRRRRPLAAADAARRPHTRRPDGPAMGDPHGELSQHRPDTRNCLEWIRAAARRMGRSVEAVRVRLGVDQVLGAPDHRAAVDAGTRLFPRRQLKVSLPQRPKVPTRTLSSRPTTSSRRLPVLTPCCCVSWALVNPKEAAAVAKQGRGARRTGAIRIATDQRLSAKVIADDRDRNRADQRHLLYELAEVGLQVAIVLAGSSILVRRRWLLATGGALSVAGVAGVALMIAGLAY